MTARAANKRETVSQPWAAGSTDGVFAPYSAAYKVRRLAESVHPQHPTKQ
jgi:hypothetical protein